MRRFKAQKSEADINCSLQQLAVAAARRFPLYRNLMKSAGIRPGEIRSLETLRRLPVVTKADLLSNLWSHCLRKRFPGVNRAKWSTSGITGPVLLVYMNGMEAWFRKFSYYQAMKENATLSRPLTIAQVGAGAHQSKKKASLIHRLARVKIERILRLLPEEQVAQLLELRPKIVTGHPTCLEVAAAWMVESGIVLQTKLVVCRGEVLSTRVRELLAQAFDGKVVDYYNTEEIGNVAYECPADPGRMHVNTDSCILEILDERDSPQPVGSEGRIIVTNLFNHTMPFLRYDLGDRGTLVSEGGTRCLCGSPRPAILPPMGRSGDFFTFQSGVRLSPRVVESLVVPTLLRAVRARSPNAQGLPPYRIAQESDVDVRVTIADSLPQDAELRKEIEDKFRRFGIEISITLDTHTDVPAEGSGKSRRVVSMIDRIS